MKKNNNNSSAAMQAGRQWGVQAVVALRVVAQAGLEARANSVAAWWDRGGCRRDQCWFMETERGAARIKMSSVPRQEATGTSLHLHLHCIWITSGPSAPPSAFRRAPPGRSVLRSRSRNTEWLYLYS